MTSGVKYPPVKLDKYVPSFDVLGDIHLDTLVGGNNHLARTIQFQKLRQHQATAKDVSLEWKKRQDSYHSPGRASTQKQDYTMNKFIKCSEDASTRHAHLHFQPLAGSHPRRE